MIGAGVLVCAVAVWALARGDDAYDQLKSDDVAERRKAVRHLGGDDSPEATEALIQAANDPADRVACEAVAYLARRGGPAETRQLVDSLRDSRSTVRATAAAGLGQLRLRKEVPPQPLINMVDDPNEDAKVRAAAAQTLGRLERFEAMPALVAAMKDKNELVRARAGKAVTEILGRDFHFRADNSDRDREIIEKIEGCWRNFEQDHQAYIRRLEERQR